jgi:hemoglobin
MKKVIATRPDVELLVSSFYEKVLKDELLAPSFAGLEMQKHLPVMYGFWSSILLDEQGYSGSPFDRHIQLNLSEALFDRWILLFEGTVNELFEGEKAELAVQRAKSIAWIFQSKLKEMGKLG